MVSRVVKQKIRGLKTGWISSGNKNGPILLLLHGYPDTPESWDYQIDHFEKNFHIVAPYTRGARPSESTSDLSRYSLESTVLDLLEILKIESGSKPKDIYCIGHDMGTLQAWALCPLLGKQIKALVIINGLSIKQALSRITSVSQLKKSWYIYLLLLPIVPKVLAQRFPAGLLKFAYHLGRLPSKNRAKLSSSITGVVDPIKQYKSVARNLPALVTEMALGPPTKINAPVMIVYGNEDPFLNLPKKDEFLKEARDPTIRIIEAGHWPQREHPVLLNTLLEDFFKCH